MQHRTVCIFNVNCTSGHRSCIRSGLEGLFTNVYTASLMCNMRRLVRKQWKETQSREHFIPCLFSFLAPCDGFSFLEPQQAEEPASQRTKGAAGNAWFRVCRVKIGKFPFSSFSLGIFMKQARKVFIYIFQKEQDMLVKNTVRVRRLSKQLILFTSADLPLKKKGKVFHPQL